MQEPSAARNFLVEEGACLDWANASGSLVSSSPEQLRLDLGEFSREQIVAAEPIREQKTTGLTELHQARSLIHDQIERIENLEQALDQSLACVAEMRVQLVNQQFLETQLASTEEIANIQQQAITHLKRQLAQQQSAIETQHQEAKGQQHSFQTLLTTLEDLAQGQQNKLEQLRIQVHSEPTLSNTRAPSAEIETQRTHIGQHIDQHLLELQDAVVTQQQRLLDLVPPASISEAASLTGNVTAADLSQAEATLQTLHQTLSDRGAAIHQLETELHRAHIALQEQQALIGSLQQAYSVKQSLDSPIDGELFSAHCKIQDLETQLSKQSTAQAMLQHAYQELEQIHDRHQARLTELEQHSADMQEQILKQAQQASEYETAIQHWKDRYHTSQDYLLRLAELIGRSQPHLADDVVELLAEIHSASADTTDSDSLTIPATPLAHWGIKKDLPDFLARRHRYRGASKALPAREKNAATPTKNE